MSYETLRNRRQQVTTDLDHTAFEQERTAVPTLHSGFLQHTTKDPNKSILQLHLYFANGSYVVRLEDREDDVQTFIECPTMVGCLDEVERQISSELCRWVPMRRRNGNGAF